MKKILSFVLMALALTLSAENMPYITRIHDFMPAPGQFVNRVPMITKPVSHDELLKTVSNSICGYVEDGDTVIANSMVSLGSFGGYVVFSFDHPVVNVKGEYDLQIFGNGFAADGVSSGGCSEPGIVMVANDLGGPWYELAGSEYNNPRVQHHFTVTYYKPDENKSPVPDPDDSAVTDKEYIRWTSNSTDSLTEGYVERNSFNRQSYWPLWFEGDSMTFTGTKLPCNASEISGEGTYWVQRCYDWGYVDNRSDYKWNGTKPKDGQNKGFDLDWAVDDNGVHVNLKQARYFKVYTAVLQTCGWIGETSTEVAGAIDLHPNAEVQPDVKGDVTGDGRVDIADVNAVINAILGITELKADVTGDGRTDIADVNALINTILN